MSAGGRMPDLQARLRTGWRYALVEHVAGGLVDLTLTTARYVVQNDEAWRAPAAAGEPVIFVLWHGRLMPLGYLHRGQGVVALASRSADGEYIARLLQHWGFGMVRGSSSRGGDVAFRDLIRTVRGGHSVAITPDGPRGPFQKMKPGVIQLAQLTGAPLVPVGAAASRAWWFTSWDRFMVPRPFSRIHVHYGDAVRVPRDADADALTAIERQVEATLLDLTHAADRASAA